MCQSKAGKGKKADPHAHVDNLPSLGLPIRFALIKSSAWIGISHVLGINQRMVRYLRARAASTREIRGLEALVTTPVNTASVHYNDSVPK